MIAELLKVRKSDSGANKNLSNPTSADGSDGNDPPASGGSGDDGRSSQGEGAVTKKGPTGSRWHKVKAEMIKKRHSLIKIVEQTQARAALTPRVDGRIVCLGTDKVGLPGSDGRIVCIDTWLR